MQPDCTNISIDLTNACVVCTYSDGQTYRIKTDLFMISDFDLIRGVQSRIRKHFNQKTGSYDARSFIAYEHLKTLDLRNGQTVKKQGVS